MKADYFPQLLSIQAAFLFFTVCAFPVLGAENPKSENPLFVWDLLWTGLWYNSVKTTDGEFPYGEDLLDGGTIYNRGDLTLGLPRLDLSFRFLATDKRFLPLVEDDPKAGFNPGFGLYHLGSGSRILYGVQSEHGLSSRISNIWLRAVPFMESRRPSSRDLKAEPAVRDRCETYLYLALPQAILPDFNIFASSAIDEEMQTAFAGGIGWNGFGPELGLEGFYTKKKLPPRNQSTWFSPAPSLPERDFQIYALGLFFHSSKAAFATDWTLSETFAWGQGVYGNFSFRAGNKPWRFSLAGDGATDRFVDLNGSDTGAGLRLAAKGERFWPRSGFLRFQGTLRSTSLEDDFSRANLSIYFRPSAPTAAQRRQKTSPVRFSRASLSVNRNARKPGKTADSLSALTGFSLGPLSSVLSCSLHSLSVLDEEGRGLFQSPVFESFESFKISGELGWKPAVRFGIIDLKTRLGYTIRAEKDPLWELSLNSSIKTGKWGRVGIKIASTDFPEKWNYTFSWRFNYGGKI